MSLTLLFAAPLALWGVLNFGKALQRNAQPTLRQERLLCGVGGLGLALTLTAWHAKRMAPAWLLLGLSLLALLAWLVSLYRQSLHNTTM